MAPNSPSNCPETALDMANPPKTEDGKLDYSQDFFGQHTNLTVSGQLEGELGAMALGGIYTFGPTFRAENSNTPRHLAEFWMIEPEIAFNDIHDNMDLAEDFLKYVISYLLKHCKDDLEFLAKMYDKELIDRLNFVIDNRFVRLTYTEGVEILEKSGKKFEYPVYWGSDLQSEHERYLVEEHFKCPVILTDYPKEIKAFYMKQNDDGKTGRAMDVLFPRIGEIIGGSEREADYDKLMAIPNSLIRKIEQNEMYGQGFATTEFLAASLLDMEYHLLKEIPRDFDIEKFEQNVIEKYGLIPQIPPRYRSTYFSHTFSGGYTAGYYMYIWAEQLDSDAFEAFLEKKNIFDPELANKLRTEIFARGGIEDAIVLYRNFRGKDPDVNALLRNRGLGK
jgi:hypothetical protein